MKGDDSTIEFNFQTQIEEIKNNSPNTKNMKTKGDDSTII